MWHDSFIWVMTHLYVTRLCPRVAGEVWPHMWHDPFTCDTTRLYVRWLIRMWHDSFLCDMLISGCVKAWQEKSAYPTNTHTHAQNTHTHTHTHAHTHTRTHTGKVGLQNDGVCLASHGNFVSIRRGISLWGHRLPYQDCVCVYWSFNDWPSVDYCHDLLHVGLSAGESCLFGTAHSYMIWLVHVLRVLKL